MNAKDVEPFLGHTSTVVTAGKEYKGVPNLIVNGDTLKFLETVYPIGGTATQKTILIPIATILRIWSLEIDLDTEKKESS